MRIYFYTFSSVCPSVIAFALVFGWQLNCYTDRHLAWFEVCSVIW